ncbi:MAG: type IV pili twitching motility protein PilT [Parcubacteria group bacterium CG08_land_8_20_14_0_20_48_21]|nr:MAG: type IV pili twitching motility protein PilT [Parcubacteria group bacterium CG08_land_8_20_14_0_20_48_21]PIW79472.1 MAG: type IV pili twitching motility protein PilT [Parcubacteria group bacterium CG_4_8_14_3_um_filter_48_16]PIY77884.1 MAG: type IV pili twitching motility protein PilT [Parcubacteria group bacterium CG_4_10_14_0_8_um_filter_48_154]PIZ76958.1 MAG: type IV pili twitching motility protein PilT [bacterium CG_4_10_14_0_2_um_filter_48_144]PJC40215.1 MAG: type IV pili twitching
MLPMQIDQLFKTAVKKNASDLHLLVGKPPILRVDGTLCEIPGLPELNAKTTQELVFSILSEKQQKKFVEERELDVSYEIAGLSRFRVNLHWEKGFPGLVARVIAGIIPTLEQITMPQMVYDLCRLPQGLILITGPTGCGKSTALAAMINLINSERSAHIITLEDPIEFMFEPKKCIIKQRQLGTDTLSFAAGLKHVLRQDPNVVMVGEMRDLETIATTITLAETGHLVLATLHTYSAAQTIDRIIDIFPPYQQNQIRLQLSITLKSVISQRLISKIGGGRIAAREFLINTPAISNMIRENKIAQIKSAIQTGADIGMRTLDQDLIELFEKQFITKEAAQAQMLNPEELPG